MSNHSYGSPGGWEWQGGWQHFGYERFGSTASRRDASTASSATPTRSGRSPRATRTARPGERTEEDPRLDCGDGIDCLAATSVEERDHRRSIADAGVDEETGVWTVEPMGMSSRGPADDGRIKPDVAALGRDVLSTNGGGTMLHAEQRHEHGLPARPERAALLVELHHRYTGGATPTADWMRRCSSTPRAPRGRQQPTPALGHGLLDVAAAAALAQEDLSGQRALIDRPEFGRRTRRITYALDVEAGAPLVVTASWTDPTGLVNSGADDDPAPALVVDLDVVLEAPDGTLHYPWRFERDGRTATAQNDGPNRADNVERIVVTDPQAGTWSAFITAEVSPRCSPSPTSRRSSMSSATGSSTC